MCTWITVRATHDDGRECSDVPVVFWEGSPPPEVGEKYGYDGCNCPLFHDSPDGRRLTDMFVREVLAPMASKVGWGNIVIEMR